MTEGPSSLLLTVNKTGNFTCKAHCDHPCFGHWVINNETVQNTESNSLPSSKWNEKGFTFLEYNFESQENEYVLRLSVNASKANNNSVIQCEYYKHDLTAGVKSRFATVLVISGE